MTVIESKGKQHKARALVDNGSCLTFVTSKLVTTLKMHKISVVNSFLIVFIVIAIYYIIMIMCDIEFFMNRLSL